MIGLLDADIICYEYGDCKDEEGTQLPLNLTLARVRERIEKIKERSGVDELKLYLTSTDKSNFRYDLATILPYKGNRPKEKSRWWSAIRHELIMNYGAEEVFGMEADDKLAIEQTDAIWWDKDKSEWCPDKSNTVIISRDKDLNTVPGWHYGWEAGLCKEKPLWFQTEIGGLRCFYKQLLTGDKSVDNILGLFGVGVKSKLVTVIDDMETEEEMYVHCHKQYTDRFGSYADTFLIENARLLHMLRTEEDVWQIPVIGTQVN